MRTIALFTVTVTGVVAAISFIGADARWLVVLGHSIALHGAIPAGVPFAAAPSAHWPNAIALAELIFHGLNAALGGRGLVIAQLICVAIAVGVLTRDAIADGAACEAAVAAMLIAVVGSIGSLAVARAQLFSIALFPVLVALLRSDARGPSNRIWLVVPLLAVWSNLHGAVLIGFGITCIYLALVRFPRQPVVAMGIGLACLVALCATPAGVRTVDYYYGVLTNEAAKQGQGLWAPLSLSSPLDILLVIAAMTLLTRLRRRSAAAWELAALLALAVLTVQAARSGMWLLFFLVAPAAKNLKARELWRRLLPALCTAGLLLLVVGIVRGPLPDGASSALVSRTVALARGTPVLADDLAAEQVALAGGRVWVSNPIDAFSRQAQTLYLDWLRGRSSGARALSAQIRVVLTLSASASHRLMIRQTVFRLAAWDRTGAIYVRSR